MKRLHTETDIDADPEAVWDVIVDFDRYHEWNPFITELRGSATVGGRLHVALSPPGGRSVTLRPRVTEVARGSSLEWLGHIGVPGVFDGRHRFEVHRTATGTRLVQDEAFTGALVPLLARSLDRHTHAGFVAMNAALKERVERSPRPAQVPRL